jgi:hypothetical protein
VQVFFSKEHGTLPVLGEQFLKLASTGNLAVGNLTVHCPNKDCKYYVQDYGVAQWNDLMGEIDGFPLVFARIFQSMPHFDLKLRSMSRRSLGERRSTTGG